MAHKGGLHELLDIDVLYIILCILLIIFMTVVVQYQPTVGITLPFDVFLCCFWLRA